jgi:surface polysaccharide O-acyltransferase-like enzyme
MVVSFWLYFDKTGKLWRELNKNSYGVYIIHVIVIGVFGTLLLKLNLPALVKYLILIVSAYGGSNLLVSGYRKLIQTTKASRSQPASPAVDLG